MFTPSHTHKMDLVFYVLKRIYDEQKFGDCLCSSCFFANYRMMIHTVAMANLQGSDFFWKPENAVKRIL